MAYEECTVYSIWIVLLDVDVHDLCCEQYNGGNAFAIISASVSIIYFRLIGYSVGGRL